MTSDIKISQISCNHIYIYKGSSFAPPGARRRAPARQYTGFLQYLGICVYMLNVSLFA